MHLFHNILRVIYIKVLISSLHKQVVDLEIIILLFISNTINILQHFLDIWDALY